jgi:hypothetical protein
VTNEVSSKIDHAIEHAVTLAAAKQQNSKAFAQLVDLLVDADGLLQHETGNASSLRPIHSIEKAIFGRLRSLWEIGWQPLDLIHVVRRESSPRIAQLATFAVQSELQRSPFVSWVPAWWQEQCEVLRSTLSQAQQSRLAHAASDHDTQPFTTWQLVAAISIAELLEDSLVLLGLLRVLRPLSLLADPPSKWESNTTRRNLSKSPPTAPTGEVDGGGIRSEHTSAVSRKTLATIRSLLAKAEATTFPAEADSFAEKAQELMTKHSIDIAMLDARHGDDLAAGVIVRRFHVDQPYAKEKVVLLATVGSINRVRVIFDEPYGLANAIGFAEDIEVTDLLFTSLLVQASHALVDVAPKGTRKDKTARSSHQASPTFRRAFWLSYAGRVAERLEEANQRATAESEADYGSALVPVLQERSDAVNARVDQMFPNVKAMKSRSVDAEGWWAGRDAADRASLGVTKGRIRK